MIDGSQDRGVDDRTTPLKGLRRDWILPTSFAPACVTCGYEDAAYLYFLRSDPPFKLPAGGCPIPARIAARSPPVSDRKRAASKRCDVEFTRCAALRGSRNLHGSSQRPRYGTST